MVFVSVRQLSFGCQLWSVLYLVSTAAIHYIYCIISTAGPDGSLPSDQAGATAAVSPAESRPGGEPEGAKSQQQQRLANILNNNKYCNFFINQHFISDDLAYKLFLTGFYNFTTVFSAFLLLIMPIMPL